VGHQGPEEQGQGLDGGGRGDQGQQEISFGQLLMEGL
jgi:hypothetical protein